MSSLAYMLVAVLVLSRNTCCQEIQIQRTFYRVAENISLDNTVLRLCVEGLNLADQAYNVQLQTEQATSNFAIDGEDYIGINEQLVLTGPGQDIRCTTVEVLEDELAESVERFGVRLSGHSLITRDSVDAFILDNDGAPFIPLEFIGDSPRLSSNQVTFELQFDPSLTSVTCEVVGQASVDCSNGLAVFTLPPDSTSAYQPRITTVNVLGEQEVFDDPNRTFRTSSSGRCSVHLINEGISYDHRTRETTFQWVWTGPGEEGRTFCVLDSRRVERCTSPYTVSGLEAGPHSMRIRVRRGQCTQRRARRDINFNLPQLD